MSFGSAATVDQLVDKICILRSNQHYRVADIVYHRGFRWEDSAAQVLDQPAFDGTIVRDYLLANGPCGPTNLPLFAGLIVEAQKNLAYPVPAADELVIHIRAGDVVEHDWFMSRDLIAAVGRAEGVRRCTIVTSIAFQEWPARNAWMYSDEKLEANILSLRGALAGLTSAYPGLPLSIYSHPDIDRDMVYLAHARHFLPDHGGFSELMAQIQPLVIHRSEAKVG